MANDAASPRQFAVLGLGVMGENLARNLDRNGFSPAVFNRSRIRTDELKASHGDDTEIKFTYSIEDFVGSIARPRRILLMVKAGPPVDAVIQELAPHLEPGDILIDGGNSLFTDTVRRDKEVADMGFMFVGMGVSGGEEGALYGPSLMPGGPREAYAELEPMLSAIAAKSEFGACVTHIGPGGSGHYVKMVHNGIEYGDMQLIAETYDIMRRALGMSAQDIAEVFERWNTGKLESFLIEITAKVLAYIDPETDHALVDVIKDQAAQKGTGRWTSQNSYELGTPIPVIDAAVSARSLSSFKAQREEASKVLTGPEMAPDGVAKLDRDTVLEQLENALYVAKISSYAQGMALLHTASITYDWNLNLSELARIWTAGCIIRAQLLQPIMEAFRDNPELTNLMLSPYFADQVNSGTAQLRAAVTTAINAGIPVPALSSALSYIDTYRQVNLPANLIQGLRDYFGAHTYERIDKEGAFHTEWMEVVKEAAKAALH